VSHSDLREHAAELEGVRMVLTHLGPEMLAHQGEAQWPCANDGLIIDV
jgi:hypothetical protein